jgi:hypothetical protein
MQKLETPLNLLIGQVELGTRINGCTDIWTRCASFGHAGDHASMQFGGGGRQEDRFGILQE